MTTGARTIVPSNGLSGCRGGQRRYADQRSRGSTGRDQAAQEKRSDPQHTADTTGVLVQHRLPPDSEETQWVVERVIPPRKIYGATAQL